MPASIAKRLSNNSSDKKIFKEAAIFYEDALNKVDYINKLVYHTPSASNQENKNKKRQQNVTWFNPPYSKIKSATTKIGQFFLHLLDTHFPKKTFLIRYSTEIKLK